MTTKQLIAELQHADPTGEGEVCVDNQDIHYVHGSAAYWNGSLQRIIRDPNLKYYNIVGGKVTDRGNKICIVTLSIEDIIENDPDIPIDISELGSNERTKRWSKWIADWRNDMKLVIAEFDKDFREEKIKKGRDAFNNLEAYCMQAPHVLNPYSDNVKGEEYKYWTEGWMDAAANYWESLGSD